LRNRQFFSLGEVNAAIRPLLDRINDKVSRHLGASRRQLFAQLDKPALKPLPVAPYVYAEWKKCRAGLDYHIAIDKHYYSVPHQLVRKELWARITARTVEVFHVGQRVASHVRTSGNGQHSTQPLPGRALRSNVPRGAITWAPKGARLMDHVPFGHWSTQTFIAALRHDRLDAPWVIDGPPLVHVNMHCRAVDEPRAVRS
jgi:hypothetical protein